MKVNIENPVKVSEGVEELQVILRGRICTQNSSKAVLLGDAIFEGDWQDTLDFANISVGVSTDKDSAEDGLQVLWSSDGVTVHDSDKFTILANNPKTFTFGSARRYVKIIYTNGTTAQGLFNLETALKKSISKSEFSQDPGSH